MITLDPTLTWTPRQLTDELGQFRHPYPFRKLPVDLIKVLQRLELIKLLVALDEPDEIKPHLAKLTQQPLGNDLSQIIGLLRKGQYADAIRQIDAFSRLHSNTALRVDGELSAIKLEIRALEHQIHTLEAEQATIEKKLRDFSTQHTLRLGDLLLQLLELRREQADEAEEAAEADYRRDNQAHDAPREEPRLDLTSDEQRELKRLFRKAAQLCHPDRVADGLKSRAEAVFSDLKEARDRNDLPRVKALLHLLEQDAILAARSETVTQKDRLTAERTRLQTIVSQLQDAILTLQQSESYQTISQITDWDVYFAATRQQLEARLSA